MLVMCQRWVGDGDRLPHIDPKFLCIIAAHLPHSAGLLNRGPEGPNPLSGAGSHYGILSSTATGTRTVTATRTELYQSQTPTNSNRLWHPVILLFVVHLLPVGVYTKFNHVHMSRWYPDIFDRIHLLFTQVHLLIDSLVEGLYVTGICLQILAEARL